MYQSGETEHGESGATAEVPPSSAHLKEGTWPQGTGPCAVRRKRENAGIVITKKTAEVAVCIGLLGSRGNFPSCGHLSESTAALFVLFGLGF